MFKKAIVYLLTAALAVSVMNPIKAVAATSGKNITWGKTTTESQSNNYYDVTFNKDKIYVAVGDDGAIARSSDTKVWKTIPLKTTDNLKAIATNGKQFVSVGSNGIILQSVNGKSWTRGSLKLSYTYEQIAPKMKSYYESSYQVNWKAKAKQSQFQFRDIIWDGKKYVAIARWEVDAGSLKKGQEYNYSSQSLHLSGSFVVTSKDGKNWDAKFMDTPDVEKIVYTGKQYTAISEEAVSSSKDLVKWKTTTPDIRGDFTDLIYSNGKYMAIGWDGNISARTGTIYTSTDGVKWKAVINKEILGSGIAEENDTYGKPNGFSDLIMNSVIWDGKQYVIAGYKGMILTSSGGTNWKMINYKWNVTFEPFGFNDKSGSQANINQIIYDGEQYVLVGNNSTILVFSDLETGTIARERPSVDFEAVIYDGGNRYLAHGDDGTIWESSTGYNWKQVKLPDFEDVEDMVYWQGIASHKGKAIAVYRTKVGWLSYSEAMYYYSDKPGSWKKMEFPKEVRGIYGVNYIKDKFYIFTNEGAITSVDGIKWSGLSLSKTLLKNITYNGKVYIGQSGKSDMTTSEDALFTSKDGKEWKKVAINKDGKKYYLTAPSVVWNGKQFVTIGGALYEWGSGFSGKNVVAFSTDGTTWTLKNADSNYYEAGSYGNKTYIAVDYNGDIYCSVNGIDYTKSEKPTSQPLSNILWDGKKFIAVGEMGIILTSTKDKDTTVPPQDKWKDNSKPYTILY